MAHREKKRKYERGYCPHCDREVSKSTWYLHYSQYFDRVSGEWRKEAGVPRREPNFNFAEESSSDPEEDTVSDFPFDATQLYDSPSNNVSIITV